MNQRGLIHWTRAVLGALTGVLCGLLKFQLESAGRGILLGSITYILSLYLILYVFRIRPDEVNVRTRDIFVGGMWGFIGLWLYFWILLLNLLFVP
ncbi:hypothetical protein B6U99_01405 [Candidatus Geothermarchaeota archaeon ex4572_27]|nr:MAG: hypothetical protein B6U99_01405 [Candidatus Geothermarchaeota archaeon ex4572_27]